MLSLCSLSRYRSVVGIATIVFFVALVRYSASAQSDLIDRIESDTDRWIELEQQIADEKASWKEDRELLSASIKVLDTEGELLAERLESNRKAGELYQNNRDRLGRSIDEQKEVLEAISDRMEGFEQRVKALAQRLPPPLIKEIEPMLKKLVPEIDGEPVAIATRAQSLISVLTAIDRFNNSLTLTHEIRQGDTGAFDTRVLYWGLSMGYATDATGSRAWQVNPGLKGWTWVESPEHLKDIMRLIEVYEKGAAPELVAMPVTIK